MSLLLSASPEGAFRRLMGLGVFRRHIDLPKSGFGVRQVPWAALSQLLAVSGRSIEARAAGLFQGTLKEVSPWGQR